MTLRHLTIFRAVCQTESITLAAEHLNMTQPAVSLTVRELEDFYGVQLFEQLQKQKDFAPGDSLVVKEYINNMPELLAAADLVISRAGALTLAELEAVGRAAVLIPSPNVAENHQYYNAMELQKAGAAVVIEEKDLTGEKLVQTVSEMLTQPGKLAEMGRNARSLSVDDSLDRIAAALLELVKKA